jgi:hypothetical protein
MITPGRQPVEQTLEASRHLDLLPEIVRNAALASTFGPIAEPAVVAVKLRNTNRC